MKIIVLPRIKRTYKIFSENEFGSVTVEKLIVKVKIEKTIYPDRSIKISTVNVLDPIELISPFSASGGCGNLVHHGGYGVGKKLKKLQGGASIYFKIDCSGNPYDYSSINKVYDGKTLSIFDADYDAPVIFLVKQTVTSPANVIFTCDVTFLNLTKARIIVQECEKEVRSIHDKDNF